MASNCVIHALLYDTEIVSRSFLSLYVIHGRIFECIPFDCVFPLFSLKGSYIHCMYCPLGNLCYTLFCLLVLLTIMCPIRVYKNMQLFGKENLKIIYWLTVFPKDILYYTMDLLLTPLYCFRFTFSTYYSKNIVADSSILNCGTLKYWQ